MEKAGQEAGGPDEGEEESEGVGHSAGEDQLKVVDGRVGIAGDGAPGLRPKARLRLPSATSHARLFQFCVRRGLRWRSGG